MPFATSPDMDYFVPSAYVSQVDKSYDDNFRRIFASDVIRSTVTELNIDGTRYPLRTSCRATYILVKGDFVVEGFSPRFAGHGKTEEMAREDWLRSVHLSFQSLLNKRGFEMTEEERKTWALLSSRIDVPVYRNQTPLVTREFGRISQARPYPLEIQWDNGIKESIQLDQVLSPDFITFKAGQPFEAVVSRHPVDGHLMRIVYITRRSMPRRLEPSEERALLDSIGSAGRLAEGSWT